MKDLAIFIGIFSGLLSLFACGDSKGPNNKSKVDMRKTQTINPNDILFTIPTINNAMSEFEKKTFTCAFSG